MGSFPFAFSLIIAEFALKSTVTGTAAEKKTRQAKPAGIVIGYAFALRDQ